MINKTLFIVTVFIFSGFLSTNASAAQGVLTANVSRVLISDPSTFGGCMAQLSVDISTGANVPLDCPPSQRWITFSCSGTYSDKATAYHKLDTAKMAKATNRPVTAFIDDTKRHNGFCYAWRIDVQ